MNAITNLLKVKHDKHKIFVHNFSYFDVTFLLNTISKLDNVFVNIVKNDTSFISLDIRFGPKGKYHKSFRDSLLMLPSPGEARPFIR